MSDIFISRRLNIKEQRFGFVRFMDVHNSREMEKNLILFGFDLEK